VSNPLAAHDAAQKETGQEPEAPEDSQEAVKSSEEDPQEDQPGIDELVKSAVAEATQAQEAAIKELRDELAVLKATPIPGGPALTAPASMQAESAKAENLAKAAHYERLAEQVNDRDLKKYYRDRAKEARGNAA
jgi:hypothetical protein